MKIARRWRSPEYMKQGVGNCSLSAANRLTEISSLVVGVSFGIKLRCLRS